MKFSSQAVENRHYAKLCVNVTFGLLVLYVFPGTQIIASHAYVVLYHAEYSHLKMLEFSHCSNSVLRYLSCKIWLVRFPWTFTQNVCLALSRFHLAVLQPRHSLKAVIWDNHRSHFVFLLSLRNHCPQFLDV